MPTLRHLLLPLLLLVPALALAELRWSVQTWRTVGNFDDDSPGNECEYVYLVSNLSTLNENLVTFTVFAGSNQGVQDPNEGLTPDDDNYLLLVPEGWTYEILDESVVFRGNGNCIVPGNVNPVLFCLYSTLIGVNTNAWAEGVSAYNGPFAPARVSVPALCRRA
jgi:hypothetical protein